MAEMQSLELPDSQRRVELERSLRTTPLDSLAALDEWRAVNVPFHAGLLGLGAILDGEPDLERAFFGEVLPHVVESALALPDRAREPLPLLERGRAGRIELSRRLVHSLLANLFLGALSPPRRGEFPRVSFSQLLALPRPHELAKLRCILEYFVRAATAEPRGRLAIRRCVLDPPRSAARWEADGRPLSELTVHGAGAIEQASGCLQVDFANRFIGGGVLSGGCVQEEIRFAASSELIVALLFCEALDDHEAIRISGSEQLSATRGYAFDLRFDRSYVDPCRRAADGTPETDVVAIDAIPFGRGRGLRGQLDEAPFLREVNKAYCGFSGGGADAEDDDRPVASGNWGCGVFGGHHQVKAIVQWIAASAAGRPLRYYTFGDRRLVGLQGFADEMRAKGATVGALWRAARLARDSSDLERSDLLAVSKSKE